MKLFSLTVLVFTFFVSTRQAQAWTFDKDFVFTKASMEFDAQNFYSKKHNRAMTSEERDSFYLIRSFREASVVLRGAEVNCEDVSRGGRANCQRLQAKITGNKATARADKKIVVDPWLTNPATGKPYPTQVSCQLTASFNGEVSPSRTIVLTPTQLSVKALEDFPKDLELCTFVANYFNEQAKNNQLKITLTNFTP